METKPNSTGPQTTMFSPRVSRTDSRKIRLLHVVRRLNFGGIEVGLVQLIRGLREQGYEQGVCCMEDRGILADELPSDVPVWSCLEGRRYRWQRPELRAVRVIRDFKPDIVHAENWAAWMDASVAWFLAGRPGRLAFTMHGWDYVGAMPWRRAFACRQMARITAAVTAVSSEVAKAFAADTGIPAARIGILSAGVDTIRLCPRAATDATQCPPAPIVFGCVARLDPIKGHEILVEAASQLVARGVRSFEVRIVSDGPKRGELESLVSRLQVQEYVHFLGHVQDVRDAYWGMDVFVLPSHREGRPITIMEAMACGLPVIATRVGSVPELLGDDPAGILVDPGDPAQLAEAMIRMIQEPQLRQRQAEFARERAVKHLSLDRMLAEYSAFYRSLVSGTYTPRSSFLD